MQCDGLAILSSGRREQVFLKANAPARRRCFTAAHELGHVVIP
ncbi:MULTISPECIES: ImmA/IrrE family metallo-endopeptidase [unclassified Nonomuraea]